MTIVFIISTYVAFFWKIQGYMWLRTVSMSAQIHGHLEILHMSDDAMCDMRPQSHLNEGYGKQ